MRTAAAVLVTLLVAGCGAQDASRLYPVEAHPGGTWKAEPGGIAGAVEAIERLDSLRAGLAETIAAREEAADAATFARVCRPVGEAAARIARENGWTVTQLSERYRNPAHAPDPEARRVLDRMEDDPALIGVVLRTGRGSEPGIRYLRRIEVRPTCLACHGPEDRRPDFVVEGYPEDRAYGFEAGDLRGVYSVFVPHEP